MVSLITDCREIKCVTLTVIEVVVPVRGLYFAQWRWQRRVNLLLGEDVGSGALQLVHHVGAPHNHAEDPQRDDVQDLCTKWGNNRTLYSLSSM